MCNGIKRRAACKVTSASRSNQIISELLDRNTEFTEVRFCPSQRGEQETNLDLLWLLAQKGFLCQSKQWRRKTNLETPNPYDRRWL